MIKLDYSLSSRERVVIGDRHDSGTEFDPMRMLGSCRQEKLGRSDRFPAARVMLTAPEFVELESVEILGKLDITPDLKSGMLTNGVMGCQKYTES
jgi:hypothetical protein